MNKIVEVTEEEKAVLIKHLEGLCEQYETFVGGSGPLREHLRAIQSAQLVLKFDEFKLEKLLGHLRGASSYDRVVYGSNPLHPILEKIQRASREG